MKEYKRDYPSFSLCGLNCGLCPRYHTDGPSKCPGCGGPDFHLKHPSCAVITCNKKHDNVEYCFQCSLYPCARYREPSKVDSFITYKNAVRDLEKAKKMGIARYQGELNKKIKILEFLLRNYDDGRRKSFYCLSVNLVELQHWEEIRETIDKRMKKLDMDEKEKIKLIIQMIESIAEKEKIELKLRKQ
jgi:hypothetical protein